MQVLPNNVNLTSIRRFTRGQNMNVFGEFIDARGGWLALFSLQCLEWPQICKTVYCIASAAVTAFQSLKKRWKMARKTGFFFSPFTFPFFNDKKGQLRWLHVCTILSIWSFCQCSSKTTKIMISLPVILPDCFRKNLNLLSGSNIKVR